MADNAQLNGMGTRNGLPDIKINWRVFFQYSVISFLFFLEAVFYADDGANEPVWQHKYYIKQLAMYQRQGRASGTLVNPYREINYWLPPGRINLTVSFFINNVSCMLMHLLCSIFIMSVKAKCLEAH